MTFVASGKITATETEATAALQRTKAAVDGTGAAARRLNTDGRRGAAGVRDLGAAATAADVALDAMSAAERQAAQDAIQLQRANGAAARSVGNLVAQFNDIGVMLQAGQNPLTLAIQQGTQITQVFGNQGAGSALRSVGAALAAMVSPLNLITIGSIAAGAAITQWLMSGGQEARTFDDAMGDLEGRVDAYREAAELAAASTTDLEARFGSAGEAARAFLAEATNDRRLDAEAGLASSIGNLLGEQKLDLPNFDFGDQQRLARQFGLSLFGFDSEARNERQTIVNEVLADMAALAQATDASVAEQVAAIDTLIESYRTAADASGGRRSEEERLFLEQLQALRQRAAEVLAINEQLAANPGPQVDVGALIAWEQYYQSRVEGERQLAAERQRAEAVAERNTATAEGILADLTREAALLETIARYGEDSAEVTALRAQQEREVLAEILDTLGVSEDLTAEIMAALAQKQAFADIDIASGIWGAASAASSLAANLSQAAAQKAALGAIGDASAQAARARIRLETVGDPVGRAGALAADEFQRSLPDGGYGMIASGRTGRLMDMEGQVRRRAEEAAALSEAANAADADYRRLQSTLSGSRGGVGRGAARGGGGVSPEQREHERAREALERLISAEERELELLRETDPVQKEMIRNRETLAVATEAERVQVEQLIRQRMQEEEAMRRAEEQAQAMRDGVNGMLEDIILNGARAEDVMRSLARALIQGAISGQGMFGGLFGGSSIGELLFPKRELGGNVYAGRIYEVNEKRQELFIPETNGYIAPNMPSGSGGDGRLQVDVNASPLLDVRIREVSQTVSSQVVQSYDRTVLPASVQRIARQPRATG